MCRNLTLTPSTDTTELASRHRQQDAASVGNMSKVSQDPQTGSFRQSLALAGLAGLFLLVGTLAGGWISSKSSRDATNRELAYKSEGERRVAMGSARLLVRELGDAITYDQALLDANKWLAVNTRRVRIKIDDADLKQVAEQVSGDEWGELLVAMGDANTVALMIRNNFPSRGDYGRRLTGAERSQLEKSMATMQTGIRALAVVAHAPPP